MILKITRGLDDRSSDREKRAARCNRIFGAVLVLAVLAGCKGVPSHGEKSARESVKSVSATYRPNGHKPELAELTSGSSLSNFLAFAMLNQPRVEAAYYEWVASVERITQARSMPDPQITFQMDVANIVSSVMPGLMMNFPGPGKLRVGAEIASAESQGKYWVFRGAALESAYQVKRAYYQLEFLSEKTRVNRETLRLLTELEQLARAQNEAGKVTLQDVLRAQIEQAKVKNDLANLEHSRSALVARFKGALGLSEDDQPPPVPDTFEPSAPDLNPEDVLNAALESNTQIKALEAEVKAAEASISLARKSKVPDSSLGVMADLKASPVFYRPTGTISLPVWRDKITAQIAEAQAKKGSARARLSAEKIRLVVDLAEKSHLYLETSGNLELLQTELLPKARQSLEVARSAYLGGQIDFFNLTDSERTLLGFELDRVEAQAQREITLAEIGLIIEGMPPESLGSEGAAMARLPPTSRATSKGMGGMK